MNRITNEQREAIVREAIAQRDAALSGAEHAQGCPAQPQPEPTSKGADGWKLVPIKPTEDMLFKMAEVDGHLRGDRDHPMLTKWEDYWNMALDASPAPPASQQREPQEAAGYLDGVNVDRLRKALTKMGCSSGAGEEDAASRLAELVNRLTLSVERFALSAPQEAGKAEKCTCIYATAKNTAAVRSGHEMGGYIKERDPSCPEHGTASKEAGKVEAVADERQPSDGDYLRWAEQAGAKINWDFESASSARVVFLTASQWGRFCDKVRALYLRPSSKSVEPVADEPVYWEYRHLDTANTPNRWSEWEICKPRNVHMNTAEDFKNEIQGYIDMGYRYELRALYLRPTQQALGEDAKDAARYRYLRAMWPMTILEDLMKKSVDRHPSAELDAAIDSILAAAGGSEK